MCSSAWETTADGRGRGPEGHEILKATLKARQEAGAGQTDPGLVGNVGDLAIVLTETGKPAEALQLLDPIVKAQNVKSGPAYSRLMEAQLTAYIATNQVQQAIATMKSLEQAGGGASLPSSTSSSASSSRRELDALRQKGNTRAFVQMHQAYKTFLTTLAASKTGQTYESLEWAGESLLSLDAYKEAEEVLQRVLKEFTQDPQFLQQPNGRAKLLRTRLKIAAALRGQGKLDQASSLVEKLLTQNPRYIEPQFEKGLLLEAEAEAGKGSWSAALRHWEGLARNLERMKPRPAYYYDAWYHVALVLSKQKETVKARQTLQGVMRLNPSVGGSRHEGEIPGPASRGSPRNEGMTNDDATHAKAYTPSGAPGPHRRGGLGSPRDAPRRRGPAHPRYDRQAGDRRGGPRPGPVGVGERSRGPGRGESRHRSRSIRSSRFAMTASPRPFPLAEARESAGQLAEAAELFKKAATEAAGRPYPQQSALFREARVLGDLALVEPDRIKEARDKLTQFLRTYPNSRQLIAARESLARLQIHAGDFSGAEATIAALAKSPKAAERAAVLRTKVLARQGKHGEAIAELDRLIASSPKNSERHRAAMLAKSESLVGMKKFKEAETLVREVIQASPPEDAEAQAPAYNTLGDCLRAPTRPKEALIAYLHTDLLYSKDKAEHPCALHAIATLFRQIKQDAKADEYALRLKQEYPRSSWNRVAAETQ